MDWQGVKVTATFLKGDRNKGPVPFLPLKLGLERPQRKFPSLREVVENLPLWNWDITTC